MVDEATESMNNELSRRPEPIEPTESGVGMEGDPLREEVTRGFNPFDAPIPGESLTKQKDAHPYEKPPKFSDLNDYLEFMFDRITSSNDTPKILESLDRGMPTQVIARKLLFDSFSKGLVSPDLALLAGDVVHGQIVAAGLKAGIKDMVVNMGDFDRKRFETKQKAEPIPMSETKEEPTESTGLLGDL